MRNCIANHKHYHGTNQRRRSCYCNVADEPVSAAGVSCSTAACLLTAELSAGWGVWPHVPAKHQHSFSIPAPGTCTARVVNELLLSFMKLCTVAGDGEYYNKDIILVNNPKTSCPYYNVKLS